MKPYYKNRNGKLYCGNCVDVLSWFPDKCIDLTVTSPPYNNLRNYQGYDFNLGVIMPELYRVTKEGGVLVWITGDRTIKGCETGTSFRQALLFMDNKWTLYDTMIYEKLNGMPLNHRRYEQMFEYMFIFSKGIPKTFNPITEECKGKGKVNKGGAKNAASLCEGLANTGGHGYGRLIKDTKIKSNVWKYYTGHGHSTLDKVAFDHPAIFPEQLAHDHIISWSNKNDMVLDPMCGSGTTLKMAEKLGRKWRGIDSSEEYCEISTKRLLGGLLR